MITLQIPMPPMPLGRNYHQKIFVVNDILCDIQNKIDTLPTDIILKLACDFYKEEQIYEAKKTLYNQVTIAWSRLKQHRGEAKKREGSI